MKCEYCQRVILYEDEWWVIRYLCDDHGYKCCHPCAVKEAKEYNPFRTDTFTLDGTPVEDWKLEHAV